MGVGNSIFDPNYVPSLLVENEASGGTTKRLAADSLTKGLLTMDYPHHEVHEGDAYAYCENNTLNNGNVRKIHLKTANTEKWNHLIIGIRGSGEFNYKLHEAPTIVSAGTAVTPRNRNRNKPDAAAMSAYHTPLHSTSGTKICEVHAGNGNNTPGDDRSTQEWILKKGTSYILFVTSEAVSNDINIDLNWYQHTNE